MGIEFRSRIGKGLRRSWSKCAVSLASPRLLPVDTCEQPRRILFKVLEDRSLDAGETLLIRIQDGCLIAVRDVHILARAIAAPEDILRTVTNSFGIACGLVTRIHDFSPTAEIAIQAPSLE
jgi:hypothetical protein